MRELVGKIGFVLLCIVIYRFGAHVPVPGASVSDLAHLFSSEDNTFIGLFNIFTGGALERLSVFALGIVPYISASIIMQLLRAFVPYLEALHKEGEKGRRKIAQYTRIFTCVLCLFQGFGLVSLFVSQGVFYDNSVYVQINAVLSIVAGSMFLMWLGEQINEHGIGNGMSMLIFVSIVSTLPSIIVQSIEQAREGAINVMAVIFMLLVLAVLSLVIVYIERAQRKIPINAPRQGHQQANAGMSHLPLKINMAGVIPAIFASSLLLLPYSLAQWFRSEEGASNSIIEDISIALGPNQPLYLILFIIAVVFFCFLYTSIVFNAKEMADNLRRSGSFILGTRPGKATAEYIDLVMTRLTLAGAAYIATVSIFPQLLASVIDVPFAFAGTSVLIVVVVAMDFWTQVQSYIFSMRYSSLMKKVQLR